MNLNKTNYENQIKIDYFITNQNHINTYIQQPLIANITKLCSGNQTQSKGTL